MSKTYSAGSEDVLISLEQMMRANHPELAKVTIGTLFVFDDESDAQVLTHQGYSSLAVVKINSLRDRAAGATDALIVVDRAGWLELDKLSRDALVDHELMHLEHAEEEKTGKPRYDSLGRPKLRMRKHDHQMGWFDAVAARHKEASIEVRQARQLIATTGQLYFDFAGAPVPVGAKVEPGKGDDAATVTSMIGRAIQRHSRKSAQKDLNS